MRTDPNAITIEKHGLSECLDRLAAQQRVNRPLSTYRLQFHKNFRFSDALRLLPYLKSLGISHIYSSPLLRARAGSTHGYDITDHNQINPEIGTEAEFYAFVDQLRQRGMGLILDTVPNHMGVGLGDNPWWQEVLENGRSAAHAHYFDIDWNPLKTELRNKLLLPILGSQYGVELEGGALRLRYDQGRFVVSYYDKVLPLDPQTWPMLFDGVMNLIDQETAEVREFLSLLGELREMPPHFVQGQEAEKRREMLPKLKARFLEMTANPAVMKLIDSAMRSVNGDPGDVASFDTMHEILEVQAYRLAHWRVSAEEINYRRFFDINDLVGLCMEQPAVFADTHRLMRKLLADGCVDGVRIDHCDGLLNPRQYLVRLQMLYAASQCAGAVPQGAVAENGIEEEVMRVFSQHDWISRSAPLYTVVEKILEPGEELPREWPVDGTSGYEFANQVMGVFILQEHEKHFSTLYQRFTEQLWDFDLQVYGAKKLVMNTALSSEVNVLAHILDEISSSDRKARDYTRKSLRDVIRETIACFPVYRSYIDERGEINERDRSYVDSAIQLAKRRNAGTAAAIFDFLREILLAERNPEREQEFDYRLKQHFRMKFQQLTGPVMAKGLEDTVCYTFNRFVALNEVGGSPKHFGFSLNDFHRANQQRAEAWPSSMLATSTHDTKRSEDVRARLAVLSEIPQAWSAQVMRWKRANAGRKMTIDDGRTVPDLNEEYLLYQTLVGAWPLVMNSAEERERFVERVVQYMTKSLHEAKVNLSWINPNPVYVKALAEFVRGIMTPARRGNFFLKQMQNFLPAVQYHGGMNSLAQTLLKIASPGIPDIYQGNEGFDFSLVDPDNRRPVDYARREALLARMDPESAPERAQLSAEVMREFPSDAAKLFVTMTALRTRARHAGIFRGGHYEALPISGAKQQHVCAFVRENPERGASRAHREAAIVVVPRFTYTLTKGKSLPAVAGVWGDTEFDGRAIPPGRYEDAFTGRRFESIGRPLLLRDVLGEFPFALLVSG